MESICGNCPSATPKIRHLIDHFDKLNVTGGDSTRQIIATKIIFIINNQWHLRAISSSSISEIRHVTLQSL